MRGSDSERQIPSVRKPVVVLGSTQPVLGVFRLRVTLLTRESLGGRGRRSAGDNSDGHGAKSSCQDTDHYEKFDVLELGTPAPHKETSGCLGVAGF